MAQSDPGRSEVVIGYVPPWEIDANRHWNTQFYLRAFQHAADQLRASCPDMALSSPVPRVDHVRFFRELRTLETFSIEALQTPGAAGGYRSAYLMRHGEDGRVSASMFSTLPVPAGQTTMPGELQEKTGARGLAAGAHEPVDCEPLLRAGRAAVTHLGVLGPGSLDAGGHLLAQAVQGCLAEGTGQLWAFLGVSHADFYDNGLGRANVEMKITRHRSPAAGTPVRLVSWVEHLGERNIQFRHRLEVLTTGLVLADISAMTLVIDLKLRRAAKIPDVIQQILRRHATSQG